MTMAAVEQVSSRRGRDEMDMDIETQSTTANHAIPKKRKRTRKVLTDKKFECTHEGCGKSYSRAEHLYRHQLNHTPKQIYRCDFPDCYRSFVRQDLCVRHRERHTTRGSQLQKRDHFAQATSPKNPPAIASSTHVGSPGGSTPSASSVSHSTIGKPEAVTPRQSSTAYSPLGQDSHSRRPLAVPDPSAAARTPSASAGYPLATGMNGTSLMNSTTYVSPQSLPMNLPVHAYSDLSLAGSTATATSLGRVDGLSALESASGPVTSGAPVGDPTFDAMSGCAYPIFGGETYNRSPFAMADDFAAWLFNEPVATTTTTSSSMGYPSTGSMMPSYLDPVQQLQNQFYINEPAYGNFFTNVIPQHPMSVTSILDPGSPQAIMSEDKRQELLHLMATRFNEAAYSAVAKRKDALMEGDMDDDSHVLSLRMMQTYIGSYWYHFHAQLPILHQPTFSADQTPNLLLLAVMAIGASTLDNIHGHEVTEVAAELANFIAWHLRWEIFMDADFRPPAKLWVFQALLLLEVYEKMYSTRALHERAHIHHDTTLTLMRRGSSLIGRSAFDSPASTREARSATGTTSSSEFAADESWSHWIKAEATRRVAFAAFVIDSTHATMFGHSAKMVAHELRLPLPCDEALWSATSAAEVARVQSSLHANGVKPTMFLDGLKKTLNGQRVRTNAFGRTILMAGLLSVSWHMNQRDLQVSSLGVAQALGGRDKWRASLLRAFDHWRRDFDEALAQTGATATAAYAHPHAYRPRHPLDEDNVFEFRNVLHGLAHMASHVDIVDCQIFAGAGRLMGRFITPKDYSTAREKMTERWATKASARDATFYALKFLSECLLSPSQDEAEPYCARDDDLLNRPWVLYFAALVVWCYGYALDGPIQPPVVLATAADQRRDMEKFLRRVGGVRSPNELETMQGRNQCMGLLMNLRDSFGNTRWELLGEARNLLESCIEKLKG